MLVGAAVAGSCLGHHAQSPAPWIPPRVVMQTADGGVYRDAELEARIDDVASHMAIEDQLALLGGTGFETRTLKHLGIQPLRMTDGPLGVRQGRATAMPAGISLGASWDPDLAERVGKALGEETLAKGRDVLLGPTINIMRTPQGGRTFEAYSEDPWLTGRLAVGWIRGLQSTGVAASVKHFAANNQEWQRDSIDVVVSERALREIYLPAFEAAVTEGGAYTVMAAYNQVNGRHCAENAFLIDQVLKGEWHFQGLVMSDWGAVHSSDDTANHGVDLEMPTGRFMNRDALEGEIYAGRVQRTAILDKVRRILRVLAWTGRLFNDAPRPAGALDTPEHRALARQAAAAGMVLLKNDKKLLPIDVSHVRRIAVVGSGAEHVPATGGGSAQVTPPYVSEPLTALRARLGAGVRVDYDPGLSRSDAERAVAVARGADIALVFAGTDAAIEGEGHDRDALTLPGGQESLISAVAAANPNTVVVLTHGQPLLMEDWVDRVAGVLDAWFPGQEGGNAIADVLLGAVNPSGKLPVTFPRRWEDAPSHDTYPGKDGRTEYAEGVFVGYRHYDTRGIEPRFPFGFGLSYTEFEYSGLEVRPGTEPHRFTARVTVKNAGARRGAEIVELYVHPPKGGTERPDRELRAFAKVDLVPGAARTLSFDLDERAFSLFDEARHTFAVPPGSYEILVGSSSRDIRQRQTVEIQ